MIKTNLYTYKPIDLKVIDGDTIRCSLNLGFDVSLQEQTFRLYGVNAPEMKTPEGKQVKATMEAWCETGRNIEIQTIKTPAGKAKREKYGRWLAIITSDGINLNEKLVELGLAVAYMV